VPGSVVVAAAGSVDHDAVVELAERTLEGSRAGEAAPEPELAPAAPRPSLRFQAKDTEQVHVCLGGTGLARHDERRYAARVLDAIFGGLSSSRLFQAVREERGLAYAVYSSPGSTPTRGRSASTSARGPTTSARRWTSSPRSSTACARTRPLRPSSRARRRTSRRA
jgi:predicted Zn-dependent peptidase